MKVSAASGVYVNISCFIDVFSLAVVAAAISANAKDPEAGEDLQTEANPAEGADSVPLRRSFQLFVWHRQKEKQSRCGRAEC